MKIIAELYIIKKDGTPVCVYEQCEPDAFVQADDFESVASMINKYIMSMSDEYSRCVVKYKRVEETEGTEGENVTD